MPSLNIWWLLIAIQAPDSTVLAGVRAAVEREPIEAFGAERGAVQVRGIQLLDIDGDGTPEAFVWLSPSFRQTPTILVYAYTAGTGAHRLSESLAPGQLQPVSGRSRDPHTLGRALDMTIGSGKAPLDTLKFLSTAATKGMSVVWYRTFVHADFRDGFATFTDLTDRVLPASDINTCGGFEFSQVDGLFAGRLAGDTVHRYLVALTTRDVTIYHFTGLGPQARLAKQTWMRPRPGDVTALVRMPDGRVGLQDRQGHIKALPAP